MTSCAQLDPGFLHESNSSFEGARSGACQDCRDDVAMNSHSAAKIESTNLARASRSFNRFLPPSVNLLRDFTKCMRDARNIEIAKMQSDTMLGVGRVILSRYPPLLSY